jgi:hypothetical protein
MSKSMSVLSDSIQKQVNDAVLVENLTKRFGEFVAVDHISISLIKKQSEAEA